MTMYIMLLSVETFIHRVVSACKGNNNILVLSMVKTNLILKKPSG